MKLEELRNKKILIVGFGVEGKATLKFLRHHFPKMTVGVVDKQDDIDYLLKQKGYDLAIKSPGVQKELINIPYTTATNIFFANVRGKTIGITGSKGKSTTSSLVDNILREAELKGHLVGNIGNPMLTELLQSNDKDDIWVCELSSFQLSDINYSSHISIMLNLFPEHMDYHGGIDEYWKAKKRIVAKATIKDYFIFNPAYPQLKQLAKNIKARPVPFTEKLPLRENEIPLLGKHNIDNVRAAVTVARLIKISEKHIANGIKNFKPLPHRLELVGTFKGITFYDDAISPNPTSTIKAIETIENVGTIFLGGQDRGWDFRKLADTVLQYKIPNIVLFKDSGEKIYKTILMRAKKIKIKAPTAFPAKNMEKAVKIAYQHTPKYTICLLSCASPSFSLWKNFEEKGDLFQKFVKKYS